MSDRIQGTSERDRQVQSLIAAYLEAVRNEKAPPREEWLAARPELADDLRRFLDNHDWMLALGQPARQDVSEETTPTTPESMSPSPLGKVRYFGDYELLEEVARGGMGVIFKARQISLNRIVALKMILAGQLASDRDVQRFRAEAEAVANLDHPNIVPLYETGEHEGQHYFSMKFVEGGSLAGAMPAFHHDPKRAATLLGQVARAIHFAHQRGILHRDIKPANILLGSDGAALITDFGLARRVDGDRSQMPSGAIVGTPSYMAPEQARGEKQLTTAADVWALGAVLYECLAGRPPFHADNVMDTLMQVIDREPEHPRAINPRADADLCVIALKCLNKAPARRYESPAALADDLGRFLAGEPIQARPTGMAERLLLWMRRNPAVAGLTAAVAASLLLGVVVATVFAVRANENAKQAGREANRAIEEAGRADREAREAKTARGQAEEKEKEAKAEAHRANVGRHGFQMTAAWQAWQQHDVAAALMEEVPPEFQQTWEYHHVRALCRRKALPLKGHTNNVTSVAYSPDGKRIVSGSGRPHIRKQPGEVKVWDAATGQDLRTLKGHTSVVNSVAYSPDGRRIVSGSLDNTLKVWDAATGQDLRTLKGHTDSVLSVAYSPDSKRIVSGSADNTVKVWDAATGQDLLTLKGHTSEVYSVAYSPDGKRIVSGSRDQTLKVWDAGTGHVILTLQAPGVHSVAYSPDGKRIVSGSDDYTLKVWDAATGQDLLTLKGHTSFVYSVAYSPDGKRIVSGSWDETLKVWDAATGQDLLTLKGHTEWVTSVAYSPDGKRIVSGSWDETLKVWDAATGQELLTLKGHTRDVMTVAYSPDSKRIVSGSEDCTLKVWDAATGQDLLTLKGHAHLVTSVAYSPDGKRIVSGSYDKTVKVWDAATGQHLLTLKGDTGEVASVAYNPDGKRIVSGIGHPYARKQFGEVKVWDAATGQDLLTLKGHTSEVYSVAYSPDGKHIVSGSADQTVKVWDAATGQDLLTLKGHTEWVNSVAYSPDGKRIVSGSKDNTVKVWDAATGQDLLTLKGHTIGVNSVAYSPDGKRIVSGSGDKTVKVWDAATGQDILTLKGHTGVVHSVAYSPNGKRIVSGSRDNTLKVWDAPAGPDLLSVLQGHTGQVNNVAYSPDGKRIVSGSDDKTVKVWDAATGQDLLTLKGHTGGVNSVAYSPDGKRIVSGSGDKTVKVWDAATGQHLLTLKGHTIGVNSVAYSPDGKRIVSGSDDKTVKVWDAATGQDLLTLQGHTLGVVSVAYSPDGKRIVSGTYDNTVKVWDAASGLLLPNAPAIMPAGSRSVAVFGDVQARADGHFICLERILSPEEQQRLRQEEERIASFLRARATLEFHTTEAETAENNHQPFAAVFHLDRLLPLLPHQRRELLERRNAVLVFALKADAKDAWAIRALARQAISDPDTVPDEKALLPALADLAKHQNDAFTHRLHGGLLLRTRSEKEAEAIAALTRAIAKRGPDAPPVEELLLALAHAWLGQPAEASKHRQAAVAWMQRGAGTVQAVCLTGLACRSPLAALAGLAVEPPDPRLNPLDHQTAYELKMLRAEVDKALGTKR